MGALTGWATDTLSVSKLFFNIGIKPATAILGIFSISTMGIGILGFLSPMIVAPSEVVYWAGLPTIITIQALHWDMEGNRRRLKIFSIAMGAAFVWEIIPSWIAPWLNGISIPCLASMHASHSVRKTISRIFGGAAPNEGLGFLSISLDTQFVSFGQFAGYPLKWQIQYFAGSITGAFMLIALYYSNAWNAKSFPFMTPTLFKADGTVYDQMQVFDEGYRVNKTALAEYGLPHMSVAEIFSFFTTALGLGGLVTHVIIFLGKEVIKDFKSFHSGTLKDRHWQALHKNYKPVPNWFYYGLSIVSVIAAFIVTYVADTTLSWWGLVLALAFGTFMTPISLSIYGRYGSAVPTMMASKTIAGAIRPGRPLANLWFCQYSHQVVEVSGTLAGNLKAGQYLKIPPRVNIFAQLWGTLLGAYLSWWMMSIVIRERHDILLDPNGNNQWYGGYYQDLNAQAVEWSLAYKVFSINGGLHYEWIPLGFLIGALLPCIHWVCKRYIKCVRDAGELIATPIFCYFLSNLGGGINSPFTSCMILALFCQVWLRTRRPRLFNELNYVVAAAVDGGVSIVIFILSFAVMGAASSYHPFPEWFGNPSAPTAPDHCLTGSG
ncbi:unnamed protein product [Sympodiomycopsis kandeliae]